MKNKIGNLILSFALGMLCMFFIKQPKTEIKRIPYEVSVVVPSYQNKINILNPTPLPDLRKPEDRYNKELVNKYKKANDSLKEELYKSAVTTRKYEEQLVDSIQTITVGLSVTGTLDSINIGYTTNEKKIIVKDTLDIEIPSHKNSVTLYSELGTSLSPINQNPFVLKAGLDVTGKKSWTKGLSYDTNETLWFKIGKTFKW